MEKHKLTVAERQALADLAHAAARVMRQQKARARREAKTKPDQTQAAAEREVKRGR